MGHTRNETRKQINYNEKIEIKTSQLCDSIGRGAFASNGVELMDVKVEKFYVNSSMENWLRVELNHSAQKAYSTRPKRKIEWH